VKLAALVLRGNRRARVPTTEHWADRPDTTVTPVRDVPQHDCPGATRQSPRSRAHHRALGDRPDTTRLPLPAHRAETYRSTPAPRNTGSWKDMNRRFTPWRSMFDPCPVNTIRPASRRARGPASPNTPLSVPSLQSRSPARSRRGELITADARLPPTARKRLPPAVARATGALSARLRASTSPSRPTTPPPLPRPARLSSAHANRPNAGNSDSALT
jgi:hypothetical protein